MTYYQPRIKTYSILFSKSRLGTIHTMYYDVLCVWGFNWSCKLERSSSPPCKRTNIYHPTISNSCSGALAPEQGMSGKPQSRGVSEPAGAVGCSQLVMYWELSEISGCWANVSPLPCCAPCSCKSLSNVQLYTCWPSIAKMIKNASARFHTP